MLCNHPFLSRLHDPAEEEALGPHPVSSLVRHAGKLETLDRLLPKLKADGHKARQPLLHFVVQCCIRINLC